MHELCKIATHKAVGLLFDLHRETIKNIDRAMMGYLDGILSYRDRKVPLGYVESTNQKAKNVIRRAYGYRNQNFKKLKIIQACTP